jgi:hypothetical protein
MTEQLALIPGVKPKKAAGIGACSCGHEAALHQDGGGRCMFEPPAAPGELQKPVTYNGKTKTRAEWRRELGLNVDACPCKRFHERTRRSAQSPPLFQRPANGTTWMRGPPELKRQKAGGWFQKTADTLLILIANTKLESLNVTNRFAGARLSPEMMRMMIAGDANKRKGRTLRTIAAIEQAHVVERGEPSLTTITRIASRSLDDDNLIGACKAIRDGIAEALLFDDARFSVAHDEGKLALDYKQARAGARKTYAVLIELKWKG